MEYFGDPWGTSEGPASICDPDSVRQAPTPVGDPCVECETPIQEGDQGVLTTHAWGAGIVTNEPHHIRCLLRKVAGPDIRIPGFLEGRQT